MQTDRFSQTQSQSKQVDAGLRAHMSSVYNRMTVGILITAITAWLVSNSPALMVMLLGGPQAYVIMLAPLAIVWFGFNPASMSSQKLKLSFVAVSVIYGISFSTIALALVETSRNSVSRCWTSESKAFFSVRTWFNELILSA